MKGYFSPILLAVSLAFCANVQAKVNTGKVDKMPIGTAQLQGTYVGYSAKVPIRDATLTIVGPNGFHLKKTVEHRLPSINLTDYGKLPDGVYHYELTARTTGTVLVKDTMNNGRGDNDEVYVNKGMNQFGHFRVRNGQIQRFLPLKEPTWRGK